jgi:hypothetical protein
VRGGDDADYEAELLESPACRAKGKKTSANKLVGFLCRSPSHPIHPSSPSYSSPPSLLLLLLLSQREKRIKKTSKLTHNNPPRAILLRIIGSHRIHRYAYRADDGGEYQRHERVLGDVRAVPALGEAQGDFVAEVAGEEHCDEGRGEGAALFEDRCQL